MMRSKLLAWRREFYAKRFTMRPKLQPKPGGTACSTKDKGDRSQGNGKENAVAHKTGMRTMLQHQGHCPQCGQVVTPRRLEANTLRRDVLECPHCQARILKCRFPGCKDYALGGEFWDNEFCPDCTKTVAQTAISGGLALALARFGLPRRPWPPIMR